MVKPSGMFRYAVSIDGANTTVEKNLLVDPDELGNTLSALAGWTAAEIFKVIDFNFTPYALGGAANAGLVLAGYSINVTDGVLTAVTVRATNANALIADAVAGYLYMRIHHKENLLL